MVVMGESTVREEKTYSGDLMEKGKSNEDIVLLWLESIAKEVVDCREFRVLQRMDIDCGIETIDGKIVLAEVKSDRWIGEDGNICFEVNRINHFATDHWFYLGWGWRSPAQKLIIRNPETGDTFVFDFSLLRKKVGEWVGQVGKNLKIAIVETDKQKTTFNYLIPMSYLTYKKYIVR